MSLGWDAPLAASMRDPALRAVLGDLQRTLTWPFVGLRRQTNQSAQQNPITWPVTLSDESGLHRGSGNIQVPSDFNHWLAIGACSGIWSNSSTNSCLLIWRRGTSDTPWNGTARHTGTLRASAPFFGLVEAGDLLNVRAATSGSNTLTEAEIFVVFIPLR
jgi:hypothetical protein